MQIIFFLGIIILFFACASQSPLTGGERDTTPPKLVRSVPQTGSVNVSPQRIDFEFDEFIQVKSLNQKLIVSPPLKYMPELKQKTKGFSLIIKDTLKPNTTYNFYFGDAIQDLNENNPLNDFNYVFSTGDHLDSLQLTGTVIDALTLTPENNFLVMLYTDTSDSVPFKIKPNYITRTNSNGFFRFNYLKNNTYKIIGIGDKNNNYMFDASNEKIAFQTNTITLNSKKNDSLVLYSFIEDRTKQYIKKTERKLPYKANIIFNTISNQKPVIHFSNLDILDYYITTNNDTIIIFFNDSLQYLNETLKLKITYYRSDSLKNSITVVDTINLKWTGKENYKPTTNTNFHWNITNNAKISSKQIISILFDEPVFLDNSAIEIVDSSKKQIPFILFKDSTNCLKWNIKASLADGKYYRILLNSASVKCPYGHSLKNDTLTFETLQPEDFANLKFNIKLPYAENFIIELINEKNNIVKTWNINSDTNIYVERLLPGKYSLKAIADTNKNGKWDNGYYILHLQPEKIYNYYQTIQLKANWDMEINWIIK
ncbi:MAG: Ig-like domain-containing protein [Bacteroidales bacterium]